MRGMVTEINGWLSVEDAAKVARLTTRAIYSRIKNDPKRTPSKMIFGRLFVRRDKLVNFEKKSPPGRPRNGQHKPRSTQRR